MVIGAGFLLSLGEPSAKLVGRWEIPESKADAAEELKSPLFTSGGITPVVTGRKVNACPPTPVGSNGAPIVKIGAAAAAGGASECGRPRFREFASSPGASSSGWNKGVSFPSSVPPSAEVDKRGLGGRGSGQ
jgi:hypothetical protein